MAVCLLWNAQSTKAQSITTTLTVEISIDGDGRITFVQNGFVTPPSGIVPSQFTQNAASFLAFGQGSRQIGALNSGNYDQYTFLNSNQQLSTGCLLGGIAGFTIDPGLPTVLASADTLNIPAGYNGAVNILDGTSTSTAIYGTLAGIGFNEGGICFFEYDVDGDSNTGDANGNDARIEWRVLMLPSSSPSAQPSFSPSAQPSFSPSAQPSFSPSVQPSFSPSVTPSAKPSVQPSSSPSTQPSTMPSVAPSAQPTFSPSSQPSVTPSVTPSADPTMSNVPTISDCLKRSTKSPGKGKGMKMRKTTKTAGPTGCLETKSPGKGMMMMGGKGMMRGKEGRGKGKGHRNTA